MRLPLACLAGVAAGLSFEPFALVWLLVPAVALLTWTCRGRSLHGGLATGIGFGLAFMLTLLPWLQVIGADAWIGLSAIQALFYGVLGAATTAVQRLPWWPVWTAAAWVGIELARETVPFDGFPWGRLAFATVDTPAGDLAAYVGAAGVTFVVALLGATLAWAVLVVARSPLRAGLGLAFAVLLACLGSLFPLGSPVPTADLPVAQVAAVQGNVPGAGMNAFAERRAVLDNHVQATLDLAAAVRRGERPQPDLVIWPENSTDIDPFADPTVMRDISAAVSAVGAPTLVGALSRGPDGGAPRNVGIVWDPEAGPGETYAKRHLVPFGEFIPLRGALRPYFSRLEQVGEDKVAGEEPGVLRMGPALVGDVICFEVAYDELLYDVVDGGAGLVVVQTNNATYIDTGQIEQQFAITRLRAIETGRYVVVAATNGVSGIITPTGEVLERTAARTQQVLSQAVPLRSAVTPGTEWGQAVKWLLSLVGVTAVVVAVGLRRRSTPALPGATAGTDSAPTQPVSPPICPGEGAGEAERAPGERVPEERR